MMARILTLTLAGGLALAAPAGAAYASVETEEAKAAASDAAYVARDHLSEEFGREVLPNGRFVWKKGADSGSVTRVVVSLSDQMAYAYAGDELVGASSISSGKDTKPTPSGIFTVLEKKRMHRSIKYDNAPMPFMQRIDRYGIALHAGQLPGYPASHGCVRLPAGFAAKLFDATSVGTEVLIGS